ncbi:MAG TPA: hypothetical protein DGH68_05580, partial [Bacteroidetes bacterium]|nr:hypothetical protein [Bacteroidota bacterium]
MTRSGRGFRTPRVLFLHSNFSIFSAGTTPSFRMRLRIPFPLFTLLAIPLAVLIDGCSKEPTQEERQADSTLVLAKSQLDGGDYRAGRTSLLSALSLDLKLNRTQQLAEEYSLLGHACALSAEFDSALGYFTRGIEQYKSLTDRRNARTLLLEVASLHRQMGEERIAYEMYAEALRLSTVFKDADGIGEFQFAMLPTCRALDKIEEHAQATNNLLRLYGESGNQRMEAKAHLESALSFIWRQEYQQATDPLLRSLTLANQAKDSLLVINILSTLASTYAKAGNIQQSFETYTDALTRADHTTGAQKIRLEMLLRVGNIYLKNHQCLEAERFCRAALGSAINQKNRLAEGYLFIQLGHCALGLGDLDGAFKNMQSAIDLFASANYGPGIAFANASLGIASQRANHPNEATGYLKKAVEENEHCAGRAENIFAECEEVMLLDLSYHDLLVEHLLQIGHTDEAFWYAERDIQCSLQRNLFALELKTRNDLVNTLLLKLEHLRGSRVGAERQLANVLTNGPENRMLSEGIVALLKKAESGCEELGAAIMKADPSLEPAIMFNGISIVDVQSQLPPGTVLLRNIPTNRSVYSYAITNARATLQLAAVGRERFRNTVSDYGKTVRQLEALVDSPGIQRLPLEQHMQDLSTQLYAALVRPVESVLQGATNVLVVPSHGNLWVPIHALRRGSSFPPYCIEQFGVTYLPSCATLSIHKAPTAPVRDVVGLGHPGTTSWDVEYELRDIRAFYKDARLYFGLQASPGTLQREHGDLLHLALDLRYSARSPGNACVLLSDPKARDLTKEMRWGELLTTPAFPTTVIS